MTSETDVGSFLDAYDDAYRNFIELTPESEIRHLISISTQHRKAPWYFYYSIAQDSRFKKQIKSILYRHLAAHPLQLKSRIVRLLLKRVNSR
jgi:GT2 family glycosyltransferase